MRWETSRPTEATLSKSNQNASFSFQISESPPPAEVLDQPEPDDLDLDLSDFSTFGAEIPQEIERHSPEQAKEAIEHTEEAIPAVADSPDVSPAKTAPTIKKIQFPTRKSPAASVSPGPAPEEKSRPKTHFSKSISSEGVRSPLDSEPDRESSLPPEPTTSAHTASHHLAVPEDLPAPGNLLTQGGDSWGTDTPNAQEIWKKARRTWNITSRHALALGGQGLRAGRELAKDANEKMRARLKEAAAERVEDDAQVFADESQATQNLQGNLPKRTAPGSGAGRMILGLAKSTGRKLAAPLSAVAAASLVYLGGTHLLGAEGMSPLSHHSQATDIPDLGSVDDTESQPSEDLSDDLGEESEDDSSNSSPKKKKSRSGKAPAMAAEITEMPDGLSWPGKGLIEVVTSEEELIYVDGVFTGRGPLRRIPVSPGEHEVSIRTGGKKREGVVQVELNRNTRAVFKGE